MAPKKDKATAVAKKETKPKKEKKTKDPNAVRPRLPLSHQPSQSPSQRPHKLLIPAAVPSRSRSGRLRHTSITLRTHDRRSRRQTLACASCVPCLLSPFPEADAPVPATVSDLTGRVLHLQGRD